MRMLELIRRDFPARSFQAQRGADGPQVAVEVAQDFIVSESQRAVAFRLDTVCAAGRTPPAQGAARRRVR